ncbi:hypothetical protein N2152v2_007745 [Parachlorella kessleri]
MEDPLVVLWVIGFCVALSLVTEVAQYLFIYRTQSFKTLKANLEKHAKKLDEAKSATSKNLKKKQARLDNWREEAGRQVVSLNYKSGFVTMVIVFAGFKLLNQWFGGQVAARLPFEPPAFLQKLTHRGLEGSKVTDCSPLFLYALCQASLRPAISKILGWGPSRVMMDIKPSIPKQLQFDLFKDK